MKENLSLNDDVSYLNGYVILVVVCYLIINIGDYTQNNIQGRSCFKKDLICVAVKDMSAMFKLGAWHPNSYIPI